jgi:hypothetical protein
MDRRTPWIAGLIAVVAGLAAWPLLLGQRGDRAPSPPGAGARAPEGETSTREDQGTLAKPRQPAHSTAGAPPASDPARAEPAGDSALARRLEAVAASFLTDQPRVADLLALCEELASLAAVDPDSLQVVRDADGEVRFIRGALAIGDLRGTFLDEDGTYQVRISSAQTQPPWGGRDLALTFGEEPSATRECHVTVQFQPRAGEPASRHLAEGEERLVGWGVGISPTTGAVARPLTLRAEGDAWQIGEGVGWRELELPWISGARGFEAWRRLLQTVVR